MKERIAGMKRIVALILALLMAFALCGCGDNSSVSIEEHEILLAENERLKEQLSQYSSQAETTSDNTTPAVSAEKTNTKKVDGIKFRDFEWGMTKNEVLQHIKENKADIGLPSEDTVELLDSYIIDLLPLMIYVEDNEEKNIEKEYGRYRVNYNKLTWWLFNQVDVAGYEASLEMRFANPVVNGEIEENSDDGRFFEAEYSIRCEDKWESNKTYNELLEKLLTVYDSANVVGSGLYDFDYTISSDNEVLDAKLLKADDNSRILLCRVHSRWGGGSDIVYIVYFSPNIFELTKDSVEYYLARDKESEAKRRAEEAEKKENVNGL